MLYSFAVTSHLHGSMEDLLYSPRPLRHGGLPGSIRLSAVCSRGTCTVGPLGLVTVLTLELVREAGVEEGLRAPMSYHI